MIPPFARHLVVAHVASTSVAMTLVLCVATAAGNSMGALPYLILAAPVMLPVCLLVGLVIRPGPALAAMATMLLAYAVSGRYALSLVRRRYLRGERLRNGLCLSCGYDLRATPDRCPECGHIPAGTAT